MDVMLVETSQMRTNKWDEMRRLYDFQEFSCLVIGNKLGQDYPSRLIHNQYKLWQLHMRPQ